MLRARQLARVGKLLHTFAGRGEIRIRRREEFCCSGDDGGDNDHGDAPSKAAPKVVTA